MEVDYTLFGVIAASENDPFWTKFLTVNFNIECGFVITPFWVSLWESTLRLKERAAFSPKSVSVNPLI